MVKLEKLIETPPRYESCNSDNEIKKICFYCAKEMNMIGIYHTIIPSGSSRFSIKPDPDYCQTVFIVE